MALLTNSSFRHNVVVVLVSCVIFGGITTRLKDLQRSRNTARAINCWDDGCGFHIIPLWHAIMWHGAFKVAVCWFEFHIFSKWLHMSLCNCVWFLDLQIERSMMWKHHTRCKRNHGLAWINSLWRYWKRQ
jgi:hypothetical protein